MSREICLGDGRGGFMRVCYDTRGDFFQVWMWRTYRWGVIFCKDRGGSTLIY